jgi:hypothetical protein
LAQTPFGFVVTNLQLKEYNGLHLANVALSLGSAPTCIVYVHERLASLVRIVEETGAYFETAESLPGTLRGYIEEGVFSNREVAPCLKPHHDLPGRSN